ncbi:MAG: kinase anchor protein, partial [Halobacteriales archaeon]|nr:kinase anchor protein [Halobacteriales archaeon]
RQEADDFEFDDDASDGTHGIPITYTRDILSDLLAVTRDRRHPDLPVEDVVTPADVLDRMVDGLREAPVFSTSEHEEFEERVVAVRDHIFARQEADVLGAMLAEHRTEEETVAEYVEHVYAWAQDEPVEIARGDRIEPDPLKMKVFEIEQLGRFDEEHYAGSDPSPAVAAFRNEKIITAINRHAWDARTDDFGTGDVDLTDIPVLKAVLAENDWDDVRRVFEDFDPHQWADPPSGTETAAVKERTIERLTQREYSTASAELASQHVMEQVSYQWD